jgi:hypothetical protein
MNAPDFTSKVTTGRGCTDMTDAVRWLMSPETEPNGGVTDSHKRLVQAPETAFFLNRSSAEMQDF